MKRHLLALVLALGMIALPVPVSSAGDRHHKEPPITQNAKLRQVRYFSFDYRRACPSCTDPYKNQNIKVATGHVKGKIGTYRLAEASRKWDFYFVDADYVVSNRKGDEDWGWVDVTVQSNARPRTFHASYSSGIGKVADDDCDSYGLSLSAGIGPVSASVPIAEFTTCAKDSNIENVPAERGRRYTVNRINGVKSVNFRRFVQVKAGTLPKFRVSTRWNNESGKVQCGQIPSGSGSGTVYDCWLTRTMAYKTIKLGSGT